MIPSIKEIKRLHGYKKDLISKKLGEFKSLPQEHYRAELLFCLLTPQSNAKRCWDAVCEIKKISDPRAQAVERILKTRTRFHRNKTRYVLEALGRWNEIKNILSTSDKKELRNWLAKNVKGLGHKEASHFLRNIGHSENQLAILDRHILRALKQIGVVQSEFIKSPKHYLELESAFLKFAKKIKIPPDELDLLFWSSATGEIFK